MKYLPHLMFANERGMIPNIQPIKNWQTGIKEFYRNKEDKKIEKYTEHLREDLETITGKPEIKLRWDKERGLDGINLGTQPAIYFNEDDNWQEHNLGTKSSLTAMAILLKYYHILSKYVKE